MQVDDNLPPLWKHQALGIERARLSKDFALFFEPGCGKTRTVLAIVQEHFVRERAMLPTLILCPSIVISNWRDEIKRYTDWPEKQVVLLKGPGPVRLKTLAAARMRYPEGFVAVTNYEALVAIKGMQEALLDWAPDVVIWDESQRLKTHNSKRTLQAHKIALKARYRYLLSGTPILNSPMDVWAQYKAMDLGKTFGTNFWGFRARYFYDKNAGMPKDKHFPEWALRSGASEDFQKSLSDTSLVIKKQDCLDLPPLIRQVVYVELSPEQKKHYNQMKAELITYLGDAACVAHLAITKALRLQQIVSGHLMLDDDESTCVQFKDTPREKALEELLENLLEDPAHKVLVWACWRADYATIRRVCERLGVKYVEVHGEVSERNKQLAVETFRSDASVRVYLGHPGSGGIGINLVEAAYMIYYSRSFKLEDDLQSEARNYRAGSEAHASVTRIDLVAENTIDAEVQKALAEKKTMGESLLRRIEWT